MHPYTKALMSAVPMPGPASAGRKRERILLTGDVPSPINPPPRLPVPHPVLEGAGDLQDVQEPPLVALRTGHQVACHFPENADGPAASPTLEKAAPAPAE